MKTLIKILLIIGMALYSFTAYPKNITIYELMIDFGNDYIFIHEIILSKSKCDKRASELSQELKSQNAKVFCIKRGI